MIPEGEKVAARDTFRGTHHGDFMGLPPTGNRVTLQAIHIYRFSEGKLAEHWVARDDPGMVATTRRDPTNPTRPDPDHPTRKTHPATGS